MPSSTFSGLFPNGLSSTLAIKFEIFCFSNTDPILLEQGGRSAGDTTNWPMISVAHLQDVNLHYFPIIPHHVPCVEPQLSCPSMGRVECTAHFFWGGNR